MKFDLVPPIAPDGVQHPLAHARVLPPPACPRRPIVSGLARLTALLRPKAPAVPALTRLLG
jgi:hypothetical protein